VVRLYRPARPTFGLPEIYGLIGVALLVVARFVPIARWLPFWGCTLRRATGMPCLSCGMTRAFDWFMQGRFLDSLAINPLGFLLAVLAAIGGLYVLLFALRVRTPRLEVALSPRAQTAARYGVLLLLAANWGYLVARTLMQRT
jgi:Protein of unknown function (DUF2752)